MAIKAVFATLLISMLLVGGIASYYAALREPVGLESFRTRAEFQSYLEALQHAQFEEGGLLPRGPGETMDLDTNTITAGQAEFSGTNVQVAGVDEADLVKTDGEFLYLASREEVAVILAHPPSEMRVVSRISASDLAGEREGAPHIIGLFLFEETLVVITSVYTRGPFDGPPVAESLAILPDGRTGVFLYSVQDPSEPALLDTYDLTGAYRASRMKGSTVYLVLYQTLWVQEKEASYPTVCRDGRCEPYEAGRIYYDPEARDGGSLTNVVAIDLRSGAWGYLSVLTGFTSTVYMSPDNLYVTFAKWGRGGPFLALADEEVWDTASTSIYRIAVDGTDLIPAAGGRVKGWLLNQFALDEHAAHLRVATTTWGEPQENHVYVMDDAMQVVGALEGLAPGESIYSARFVGDLGYLVTFQKVDPFFVLDLSDPERPAVLGYLKIPGFSEYLHPLDETHILGVGKDTIEDPSGRFAWFQGLKLSLFDVSDLREPREVAKYLLGGRGSSTPVLYDHKAFLYIGESRLVVLPVDLVEEFEASEEGEERPPWEYGADPWQGAVVLSVTPEAGFEERTRISHVPEGQVPCRYGFGPYAVIRSLHVGTFLYTISDSLLMAHSLDDFAEAGSLAYGEVPGDHVC